MSKEPTLTLVAPSDSQPEWIQLLRPRRAKTPWTWIGLLLATAVLPLAKSLSPRQDPPV